MSGESDNSSESSNVEAESSKSQQPLKRGEALETYHPHIENSQFCCEYKYFRCFISFVKLMSNATTYCVKSRFTVLEDESASRTPIIFEKHYDGNLTLFFGRTHKNFIARKRVTEK